MFALIGCMDWGHGNRVVMLVLDYVHGCWCGGLESALSIVIRDKRWIALVPGLSETLRCILIVWRGSLHEWARHVCDDWWRCRLETNAFWLQIEKRWRVHGQHITCCIALSCRNLTKSRLCLVCKGTATRKILIEWTVWSTTKDGIHRCWIDLSLSHWILSECCSCWLPSWKIIELSWSCWWLEHWVNRTVIFQLIFSNWDLFR